MFCSLQSSLHQTSSESEHSIRVHPQAIYAPAAPPSFTAMPILGVPPRHQIHAQQHQHQQQPQRIFNAYDHQRVGSFRSRLKKQHPISCADQNDTSASATNNITVDVERHSHRETSAPFPSLLPSNDQHLVQKREPSPETAHNTYQVGTEKNWMAALGSSNNGNCNKVQSFVMADSNNISARDRMEANHQLLTSTTSSSYSASESHPMQGLSKKPNHHSKKFWRIGKTSSSSRSEGSNKSNSFHSSM